MSRWKCHPGHVSLSYLIANTDVSEKRFYAMLRERDPLLEELGHCVEQHGEKSMQHTFRLTAVDRHARKLRKRVPTEAIAARMQKRFIRTERPKRQCFTLPREFIFFSVSGRVTWPRSIDARV
jgi:hypothetical protein